MKLSISMTRRERLLGGSYLILSLFALPTLLVLTSTLLSIPLSESNLNLIYFGLNFLCAVGIFHRFLIATVRHTADRIWRCLRFGAIGLLLYFGATELVSRGILWLRPDFFNVNDASISSMVYEYPLLWNFSAVLLVPISEELFYRGLLFQGLQAKNRLVAYAVSTVIFAGIHVVGYIGQYDWVQLMLCFAQYLPAGLTLAWAYEKSDTIIAPMLMHITINQIGVAATR